MIDLIIFIICSMSLGGFIGYCIGNPNWMDIFFDYENDLEIIETKEGRNIIYLNGEELKEHKE